MTQIRELRRGADVEHPRALSHERLGAGAVHLGDVTIERRIELHQTIVQAPHEREPANRAGRTTCPP